jgi:hypothetical protein
MSTFNSSTLSLTSDSTSPASSNGLLVDDARSCPSLRCDVDAPHTYEYPPISPYRYTLPIVYIRRFNRRMDPYPQTNIWEVIDGVPDRLDQPVYIDGFGELTLSEVPVGDEDWKVLVGRSVIGTAVVVLALRREKEESPRTINFHTRLFSLFTRCLS